MGGGGGGGGVDTFLMEHMPKSTQRVGGVYFVIYEKYFFVTKKKVPWYFFEKYHGTFLVIKMLKFVSYIRYTVKKSIKHNK